MKKLRLGVVVVVLWLGSLGDAQAAPPAPNSADMFGQKTTELFTAMQKKDAAALEKMIAADYVYTLVTGESTNRQAFIEATAKFLTIESFKLTPIAVHIYGDAAVVVYRNALRATVAGKPWNPLLASTDTWVKQGGTWLLASHHVSMVVQPAH